MASQISNLETTTSFEIIGSTINIKTAYSRILPTLIEVRITDTVGVMEGTPYIEGELLIKYKSTQVLAYINDMGELILVGTVEVNDYSIDTTGDLIYSE